MEEIERKFLVKELPENLNEYKSIKIGQGYLNTESEPILRVRQKGDEFFLTYKFSTKKQKDKDYNICTEYELPITEKAFNHLKTKVDGYFISKTRYFIKLSEDLVGELDIFEDELEGLSVVEVEFKDEDSANKFEKPTWFGEDVSKDKRYRNSYLSQHGLED